ncbi:MAG TPA: hypothetical protein VGG94_08115 [Chthoniobacterales bacterium]
METSTVALPETPVSIRPSVVPRDGRALNLALFLVALFPAALVIRLIAEYGVNVPFGDEWAMIPLFAKWHDHQMTLADLFRQHNEHRIFFPKLIYLAFAQLTHWNLRGEMFFSVFLCGLTSASLYGLLRRTVGGTTRRRLTLWAISNVLIFSPAQAENWLWGFQLQMFMPTVCLVAALLVLQTPALNIARFLGVTVLALIATFSFGNGLLIWPVLGLALFLSGVNKRWIIAWAGLCVLTVALYFTGYETHPLPGHPSFPARYYVIYFLRFNGNALNLFPVPGQLTLAAAIGAGAVLLLGAMTLHFLREQRQALRAAAPWIALAAYAVGSSLIAAHSRIHEGIAQALSSRYSSISINLYIALLVLFAIAADFARPRGARFHFSRIAGSCVSPFMAMLLVWSLASFPAVYVRIRNLSELCTHGVAYLHFARVIQPSVNLRHHLHIHAEFPELMQNLAVLDRLELITPPFCHSNLLTDSADQPDRQTGEFGRCDPAVRRSATTVELSGRAFVPALEEPAPCILLAYEAGGQWFSFAILEVGEKRPDAAADFGEAYQYSGWRTIVDTSELPKKARQISAWSVDPTTGNVFKLPGTILLPVS